MQLFAVRGVKSRMCSPTHLRAPVFLSFGLVLVFAAGCSSEPEPGPSGSQQRHHDKLPAPMVGQDTFFDGQIVAELRAGAEGIPHPEPGKGSGNSSGGDSGGHSRHSGGGMGMGGGGHSRHGGGQSPDSDSEGGRSESPRPMPGSMGPTTMIHLRFTNQGSTHVELGIEDFVSPFGNFAVQPEKLALDPGQSLETEPMSSNLAGSLAEIGATLVLRLGNKAEKKLIMLHAVPAPDNPAGPEQAPDGTPKPPSVEPGK